MIRISQSTAAVLRKATFLCANDLGVNIPAGVDVSPAMQAEIEAYLRSLKVSVSVAAGAALAALLEIEGLMPRDDRPAVH